MERSTVHLRSGAWLERVHRVGGRRWSRRSAAQVTAWQAASVQRRDRGLGLRAVMVALATAIVVLAMPYPAVATCAGRTGGSYR